MIPMFLIMFVSTALAFVIDGAADALTTHSEVNRQCDVCDSSHPDC